MNKKTFQFFFIKTCVSCPGWFGSAVGASACRLLGLVPSRGMYQNKQTNKQKNQKTCVSWFGSEMQLPLCEPPCGGRGSGLQTRFPLGFASCPLFPPPWDSPWTSAGQLTLSAPDTSPPLPPPLVQLPAGRGLHPRSVTAW
uniref:Uncharacterized protein n=1 Tax=Molossus molossus TaxID=27622 RepID=A0A7J8CZI5_MOLMO|nr:hypothetical protein HJG59_009559 [Molossus molossus]